nr:hypothetical protein [Tanacetum cinerariifolium]
MALTFADTHNMIGYLTKSDASKGFDQIIDFLNASSIKVGKGFLGVDTPLFKGMLVAQQVDKSAAEVNVDDVPAAGVANEGVVDGRIIASMDTDVDVTLKDVADIAKEVAVDAETEVELNKIINWDDVIDQVQRNEKDDNAAIRYQALKRKPQTEAQARKNLMIYQRNMAGFKMDYFKGMTYDDIRSIFEKKFNSNVAYLEKTRERMKEEDSKALKRISESQVEKAAKKQKLDEDVEELKRHL